MEHTYLTQPALFENLKYWVNQSRFDLFVSFNFHADYPLSDRVKYKILSKFFNVLDTLVYGYSKRVKGKRVKRIVGIHKGDYGTNFHAHAYFNEKEVDTKQGRVKLSELIQTKWANIDKATSYAGVRHFYREDWVDYLMKKIDADAELSTDDKNSQKEEILEKAHNSGYLMHEKRTINEANDAIDTKLSNFKHKNSYIAWNREREERMQRLRNLLKERHATSLA